MGLFRTACDCFDGALARENNLITRFGGIYDILNDTFFVLCLGIVSIYKLLLINYICSAFLILGIIIYMIRHSIKELQGERTYKNMFIGYYDKFLHDNNTIVALLIFYYIKSNI